MTQPIKDRVNWEAVRAFGGELEKARSGSARIGIFVPMKLDSLVALHGDLPTLDEMRMVVKARFPKQNIELVPGVFLRIVLDDCA